MNIIQYLYYNQPSAISFLEGIGCPDYPIKFLFVDDGSKEPLKLDWPNARVLRIEEDIPWNQPAANNLGFRDIAMNSNVLRMDIDHFFEKDQIFEINKMSPGKKQVIWFSRGSGKSPHPNIYLANTLELLVAGGYNEEFCGNYGYDDKELVMRLKQKGFWFTRSDLEVHVNHAAGTKGLSRDSSVNFKKYQELLKMHEKSDIHRTVRGV